MYLTVYRRGFNCLHVSAHNDNGYPHDGRADKNP